MPAFDDPFAILEACHGHHSDGERDLFPAVRAVAEATHDATAIEAMAAFDALDHQHRDRETAWVALRDELDGFVGAGGPVPADRPARLAGGGLAGGHREARPVEEAAHRRLAGVAATIACKASLNAAAGRVSGAGRAPCSVRAPPPPSRSPHFSSVTVRCDRPA